MYEASQQSGFRPMTYEDFEQLGRESLERSAKRAESEARRHEGRSRKKVDHFRGIAAKCRADAVEQTRYVWLITIKGYGSWQYVGTTAAARGRAAVKAQWEQAPAEETRLSVARDDEPSGDVPDEYDVSAAA